MALFYPVIYIVNDKMSIVLPFAEKFAVEEVSGDVLCPRSLATTGTYTYSRKSSGLY
jgi:hypothetical protein